MVVTDTPPSLCPPSDVPEPPVGRPHVYDVSRQSVSLSWCGPAYDGGCAVSHYTIEVRDSCTKRWATLVPECQVRLARWTGGWVGGCEVSEHGA